jgi:hypothetical protein
MHGDGMSRLGVRGLEWQGGQRASRSDTGNYFPQSAESHRGDCTEPLEQNAVSLRVSHGK